MRLFPFVARTRVQKMKINKCNTCRRNGNERTVRKGNRSLLPLKWLRPEGAARTSIPPKKPPNRHDHSGQISWGRHKSWPLCGGAVCVFVLIVSNPRTKQKKCAGLSGQNYVVGQFWIPPSRPLLGGISYLLRRKSCSSCLRLSSAVGRSFALLFRWLPLCCFVCCTHALGRFCRKDRGSRLLHVSFSVGVTSRKVMDALMVIIY